MWLFDMWLFDLGAFPALGGRQHENALPVVHRTKSPNEWGARASSGATMTTMMLPMVGRPESAPLACGKIVQGRAGFEMLNEDSPDAAGEGSCGSARDRQAHKNAGRRDIEERR